MLARDFGLVHLDVDLSDNYRIFIESSSVTDYVGLITAALAVIKVHESCLEQQSWIVFSQELGSESTVNGLESILLSAYPDPFDVAVSCASGSSVNVQQHFFYFCQGIEFQCREIKCNPAARFRFREPCFCI